jgi:Ca2+-binding RTX toxin-like protein
MRIQKVAALPAGLLATLSTLAVVTLAVVPAAAEAVAPAMCQGKPATIDGSKGTVRGTDGDDVIVARGKARAVAAGAGDDLICLVNTQSWPDPDYPDDPAHDYGVAVSTGAGDDSVDASEADGKTEITLGPGADSLIGSPFGDWVSTGQATDGTGPFYVRTGSGRDRLELGPGVLIDARLGRGNDVVVQHNSYQSGFVDPGSVFDLGAGQDGVGLSDDYEADAAGETSLLVDLVNETVTWHEVSVPMRDVEDFFGQAESVRMIGNGERNQFYAHGCTVDLRGGRGADRLKISGYDYPDIAPDLDDCEPPIRLRARGEGGDDYLEGGRRHDVLLGGPGDDKAFGGKAGDDRCVAEIVVGRGCR